MPDEEDNGPEGEITVPDWVYNPGNKIRKVIFGSLVGGILAIFTPILDSILVLFRGSQPGANSVTDPVWGIADLFDYFARTTLDLFRVLIEAYFGMIMAIPQAVFGSDPGPFMGLLVLAIVVAEVVATVELIRRGVLALAAAVNLDSLMILLRGDG